MRESIMLHHVDKWKLYSANHGDYLAYSMGFKSVIWHYCNELNNSPYWMVLEKENDPTICTYCGVDIPESIVCLFKLQNWDVYNEG